MCVGASFDATLAQMTAYRRAIFINNEPNRRLPVIFNDYMNCLMGNPTEEKLFPIIDKTAEAGAAYFCIDAGWYADGSWWDSVGEWRPCALRFPHGIKFMLDYIRQKGMIPGLWLEIEVLGIACPMLDQFDNSCFFMRHGKRVINHGRYQPDFSNPKVRAHAEGVIDRLVNVYGGDWAAAGYRVDGEAYIALWRLASESETVRLPIRFAGDCEILYPSRTKAAVQAADDGILVTLQDPYSAVLLHTTDKHSSKNKIQTSSRPKTTEPHPPRVRFAFTQMDRPYGKARHPHAGSAPRRQI